MPSDLDLRRAILEEAHKGHFSIHLRSMKMYQDLKKDFFLGVNMKKDITDFVARCVISQQLKVEHQGPGGTLQPLGIPK